MTAARDLAAALVLELFVSVHRRLFVSPEEMRRLQARLDTLRMSQARKPRQAPRDWSVS